MATTRRQLLQGLGAGLAGSLFAPRLAAATPFTNTCQFNVMQIFLQRALSHRDTLWVDNDIDDPGGWCPSRKAPTVSQFAPGAVPTTYLTAGQVVGLDHDVSFGAGYHPLVAAGALDRTRLLAMRSEFAAHTIAASYALTGTLIGRPEASGLGARIQAAVGPTALPASWVLDAGRIGRITGMAASTGTFGAANRPFVIPVGSDAFVQQLYRGPAGPDAVGRQKIDDLLDLYRDRYDDMLTHDDGRVRSPAFDLFSDSTDRLLDWDAVYGLLDSGPSLDPVGANTLTDNNMTRSIAFGAHLLANGARHIAVVGGSSACPDIDTHDLVPGDGGGLDYTIHATRHNGVLWGACEALRLAIQSGQIDLDTTVIVIHSEFGRVLDGFNGSEHRASGYAALAIGGPITSRGLAGRLDFASDDAGVAVDPVTPTELHDAMTVLAGADVSAFGVDNEAALTSKVFGTTCSLPWGG